jgi:hypothetical protein
MFAVESLSMAHSVVAVLVTEMCAFPSVAPVSIGSTTAGKLFGGIVGTRTLLAGE